MTETLSLDLLEDLRRKNSALELLRRLAMAANEVSSTRSVYREALDRVCAHAAWPIGHALVMDDDDEELVDAGIWHLDDPEDLEGFRIATAAATFRPGEGLPGRVMASGEPLWVRDLTADGGYARAAEAAREGLRGAVACPVLLGDRVAAVLEFYSRRPAEPDRELLDLMLDVGAILGRVVERERRREAEERERELMREHMREQLARARAEAEAEDLARLSRELERSNAELDQFAYVASHDLKAPLRGISNLAEWIAEDLEDKLTDETREYLDLLSGRVHRMEALIEGLLSYSRAGRVREAPERVDVAELVREVVDLLDPGEGLELEIASELPVLETERLPLQQVFHNLISNAIKYGPENGVRIRVAGEPRSDGWELSVADDGVGIAPRYQERIWGMFQTLRPRDEVEGTGIGLALVKKIVDSRGGRVGVESQEGQGSRFWFTWPGEAAAAAPPERKT